LSSSSARASTSPRLKRRRGPATSASLSRCARPASLSAGRVTRRRPRMSPGRGGRCRTGRSERSKRCVTICSLCMSGGRGMAC
jgi:hypothetical protein